MCFLGPNHSVSGNKLPNLSKTVTATIKPATAVQHQAQIAATLNIAPHPQTGGRLIAPATNLQQVISPLQLQATQAKGGGAVRGKGVIQPMLTIVTPSRGIAGLTSGPPQARQVVISSKDTNSNKTVTDLSDMGSSPTSVI